MCVYVCVSSGGLKYEKAATIDPLKVKNEALRTTLTKGLEVGEYVYVACKEFANNMSNSNSNGKKK